MTDAEKIRLMFAAVAAGHTLEQRLQAIVVRNFVRIARRDVPRIFDAWESLGVVERPFSEGALEVAREKRRMRCHHPHFFSGVATPLGGGGACATTPNFSGG